MKKNLVMGIDIGTSSCKVSVYDKNGNCISKDKQSYSPIKSLTNDIEFDPNDWWENIILCIHNILNSNVEAEDIEAISLSGQVGTHIIVDEKGRPIRNAIGWQDMRAAEQSITLSETFTQSQLDEYLGAHLPISAGWPLPRLMWMNKYEKENMEKAYHWIQPKDYIIFMLTNKWVTDISSMRGLINPYTKTIAPEISEKLQLNNVNIFPKSTDPWEKIGYITKNAGHITNLPEGIPVMCGWSDFYCGLLGSGVTKVGEAFNVTGTSDHVGVLVNTNYKTEKNTSLTRYPYLLNESDILYGGLASGGGTLTWFIENIYQRKSSEDIGDVIAYLEQNPISSSEVIFLPYLSGERAPIWDSQARGTFFGMELNNTLSNLYISVLEGVAFNLRHTLELTGNNYDDISVVYASGGATRNHTWNQIKADIFNKEIILCEVEDSSCLGAAMLAAIGLGWYQNYTEAANGMVKKSKVYQPSKDKVIYYNRLYDVYKTLYPRLKDSYMMMADIKKKLED